MTLSGLKTYQFPQELVSRAKRRAAAEDSKNSVYNQYYAWGPFVITNRGEKFILKRVGTICGRKPLRAVPTLRFRTSEYEWMLQPKCDTRNREKICKKLNRLSVGFIGEDSHSGNVGRWRGINVVFDW